MLSGFLHEFRVAARSLRKGVALSLVAVGSIGAVVGTAIFFATLADGILFSPLPYSQADELVRFTARLPGRQLEESFGVSFPLYEDLRTQLRSVAEVGGFASSSQATVTPNGLRALQGDWVSANLFHLLRVDPFLGRAFRPEEDETGAAPLVILSFDLWQGDFFGDYGILGRGIRVGEEIRTVVGVMPEGFDFSTGSDYWLNLGSGDFSSWKRTACCFGSIGRLSEDRSLDQLREETTRLASSLRKVYPGMHRDLQFLVRPLRDLYVEPSLRRAAAVASLLLAAVLLVTGLNLTNLVLVRTIDRQEELSIRSWLGARRVHLAKRVLSESLLLTGAGGGVGLMLGGAGIGVFHRVFGSRLPSFFQPSLNVRVLAVALVILVLFGLLGGIFPAIRFSALSSRWAAGERGARATGSGVRRFTELILLVQFVVCFAMVTWVAALGLGYQKEVNAEVGFDTSGLAFASLRSLRDPSYEDPGSMRLLMGTLTREISERAGFSEVSLVQSGYVTTHGAFSTEEGAATSGPSARWVVGPKLTSASPSHWTALGITMLQGRPFSESEAHAGSRVAVLNEGAVSWLFGDQNPVGKRFRLDIRGLDPTWVTVVGVAGTARTSLAADPPQQPEVYVPFGLPPTWSIHVFARGRGGAEQAAGVLRETLHQLVPDQPLPRVWTYQEVREGFLRQLQGPLVVITLLATVVVLLAGMGLFGLISHQVASRRRELGIRIALGAGPGRVLFRVLEDSIALLTLGGIVGCLVAIAGAKLLGALFFRFQTPGLGVLMGVVMVMTLGAIVAGLAPTVSALKVDPLEAIRDD